MRHSDLVAFDVLLNQSRLLGVCRSNSENIGSGEARWRRDTEREDKEENG